VPSRWLHSWPTGANCLRCHDRRRRRAVGLDHVVIKAIDSPRISPTRSLFYHSRRRFRRASRTALTRVLLCEPGITSAPPLALAPLPIDYDWPSSPTRPVWAHSSHYPASASLGLLFRAPLLFRVLAGGWAPRRPHKARSHRGTDTRALGSTLVNCGPTSRQERVDATVSGRRRQQHDNDGWKRDGNPRSEPGYYHHLDTCCCQLSSGGRFDDDSPLILPLDDRNR